MIWKTDMTMKIIHLVSNKVWGGGEQYVLDLATAFAADGNDVTIVSRNFDAVTSRFKEAGLPVITMPLKGTIDLVSPFRLAKMLRGAGKAIIHVHNFKDATVAVRARSISGNKEARVVLTRHLVKPAKSMSLYRRLDAMIFVSHLAKDEFMSTSPNVDDAKITVVHNSIKQAPATMPPHTDNRQLTLMFHGRLTTEKGIEDIIKALAGTSDKEARFLIAGSGTPDYIASLKELAANRGVAERIEWLGHIKEISPLIAKADIGICPSRARESFGMSVVEYMAHGKPVITTDNGAQPEYITNGKNGLLVKPGDTAAITAAIESLRDKELRTAIGNAARATFEEKLSFPVFCNRIKEIYEKTLQ